MMAFHAIGLFWAFSIWCGEVVSVMALFESSMAFLPVAAYITLIMWWAYSSVTAVIRWQKNRD
jgi:hypothetical protein